METTVDMQLDELDENSWDLVGDDSSFSEVPAWLAIACLGFFPAVYLLGRLIRSWLL